MVLVFLMLLDDNARGVVFLVAISEVSCLSFFKVSRAERMLVLRTALVVFGENLQKGV